MSFSLKLCFLVATEQRRCGAVQVVPWRRRIEGSHLEGTDPSGCKIAASMRRVNRAHRGPRSSLRRCCPRRPSDGADEQRCDGAAPRDCFHGRGNKEMKFDGAMPEMWLTGEIRNRGGDEAEQAQPGAHARCSTDGLCGLDAAVPMPNAPETYIYTSKSMGLKHQPTLSLLHAQLSRAPGRHGRRSHTARIHRLVGEVQQDEILSGLLVSFLQPLLSPWRSSPRRIAMASSPSCKSRNLYPANNASILRACLFHCIALH